MKFAPLLFACVLAAMGCRQTSNHVICLKTTESDGVVALSFTECGDDADPTNNAGGPATCPNPMLSYDPTDPTCIEAVAAEDVTIAGRLDPMQMNTYCTTAKVGLFAGELGCEIPEVIGVAVWDELAWPPTEDPIFTLIPVDAAVATAALSSGATEYSFELPHYFPAGSIPYVAIYAGAGTCATGLAPTCDSSKAWLQQDMEWSTLSDAMGILDQVDFGLDGCTPSP